MARGGGQQPAKSETKQLRDWRGVNQTDARTAIDESELFWLENAITIGKGAIQILPAAGASVATIAAGVASLWGATLSNAAVMLAIGSDGSIVQVNSGGAQTAVAAAGTVTTSAHVTIWRDSPFLIIDPTKGYFSWDGTTFTTIDASKVGTSIAVFEGRVWIGNNRTIQYTAPATFNDFTAGNGAGSTIITDEAFQGSITALVSSQEQLWIIGQSGIEALNNVQASGTPPNVVTTFSVTNIVTNIGTNASSSVIGYLRALAFLGPFGAYALSGVTPQKLSDKLDGLFPSLTLTPDVPAAVAVVQNLICLLFQTTYHGSLARAGSPPISLVLGFTSGQWFFAVQGTALKWITTLVVNGVAQAWGTDGSHVYQLFGANTATTTTDYKVMTKLSDFGAWVTDKAALKAGVMFQASTSVSPALTLDSEKSSVAVAVSPGNAIQPVNHSGVLLSRLNSVNAPITKIAQGTVLSMSDVQHHGHFLGFTMQGTDKPYRIESFAVELEKGVEWSNP